MYIGCIIFHAANSDGTIQRTAVLPLAAGQHIAKYIPELFPGLDNFSGSISISSPFGISALALRQDRQAFGAISTDTGPLTGPFAVSGKSISLPCGM